MTGPRSPIKSVRYAKPRRRSTALRNLAFVLAGVAVLILVGAVGLWQYANSRIDRQDIQALEEYPLGVDPNTVEPAEGALNVLVVGLDTREGLTDQDLQELGTEDVGSNLTDTIMLVQVTPARQQAAVLSFPRDLRVDPPGELGVMKINAVYAHGGENALVRTVQDLTGVDLDHYASVNLAGFIQLTNAIGGVEVCLDEPKVDRFAGVDLPAGCQMLNGKQAAGFVRSRRDADQFGAADDFGRIARQQYFIRQAMSKVTSAGTLLNPLKVKRLIDVVAANLTTDRDLGAREMLRLAYSLKDLDTADLETRLVPGYYSSETGFTHPYPEKAETLFQALRRGEPLPGVGTTDPRDNELAPQDVGVWVLNGVGQEGLAGQIADGLGQQGFAIKGTSNAESFEVERTVVAYREGEEAAARKVAEALGLGEVVPLDDVPSDVSTEDLDVVVTIGSDHPASRSQA